MFKISPRFTCMNGMLTHVFHLFMTYKPRTLEHPHSLTLPTPKSGEIFVRIGRKFGLGGSIFPVVCSPSGVSRGKRGWPGESGRKRRHVGVGGWFCSIRSPRALPGGPGMAWDRRMNLGPNPDENENLGARLGRFSPCGCKKRLVGGFSGRRVEML